MKNNLHISENLWQDYLFLTQEIVKFLNKQEFDLVTELFNQREKLQKRIVDLDDHSFNTTAKGQECYLAIRQLEQAIKLKLEFLRNMSRRQNQVSHAYEGFSTSFAGQRMNRQS